MTTADNDIKLIPLDAAKELARSLTYECAAAALEMFADAIAQVTVGSGCDKTRRGADAMRRRVVEAALAAAVRWRTTAAGHGPALPAQGATGRATEGFAP